MSDRSRPTTDVGTVLLHAVLVVVFLALLLTGGRIASDEPGLEWLQIFDFLMPMENVWLLHMLAAVGLTGGIAGYVVYVSLARLGTRTRLDRSRLSALLRPGRARIAAIGVLVHWLMMLAIAAEIASGAVLFLSGGMAANSVHLYASAFLVALPLCHVGLHYAYGGLNQLLRIVRPAALVVAPLPPDFAALLAAHLAQPEKIGRFSSAALVPAPVRGAALIPLVAGILVATSIGAALLGFEWSTRLPLVVATIPQTEAPKLDGDLSDTAWTVAAVQTVWTQHGGNFTGGATPGTGQSVVEVRAVHDKKFAYFAFTWSDPTRSLKHQPLVKRRDGWHLVSTELQLDQTQNGAFEPDGEPSFIEDKFSVLIAPPGIPLIGSAIHLSQSPLSGLPGGRSGRGLHYTKPGRVADVWQWLAAHGGVIDDCHFGAPAKPTPRQIAGLDRYSGGYDEDPGEAGYAVNFKRPVEAKAGLPIGIVRPLRLPRRPQAMLASLGSVDATADQSEGEHARWWMSVGNSVPYTEQADANVPIGTVMPGILIADPSNGDRADVVGIARWNAGRWSLELARKLDTGSLNDVPIKTGDLMWVAAFDHSETRHTRHLRPLILELEP